MRGTSEGIERGWKRETYFSITILVKTFVATQENSFTDCMMVLPATLVLHACRRETLYNNFIID